MNNTKIYENICYKNVIKLNTYNLNHHLNAELNKVIIYKSIDRFSRRLSILGLFPKTSHVSRFSLTIFGMGFLKSPKDTTNRS